MFSLSAWRIFLGISAVAVVASLAVFFYPGPTLSIEFSGGTLMELQLPAEKTKEALVASIEAFAVTPPLGSIAATSTKDGSVLLRMRELSNEEHLALIAHVESTFGAVQELQFTTIGPTVGANLKQRSVWALVVASLALVAYLAMAFRKVPRQLSPWSFGLCAVIAVVHDVCIVLGVFTVLSWYTAFQVDTLFISALLSIIGYSVNDTIVIFDRIRENVQQQKNMQDFAALAAESLRQSLSRTINTGTGALIMLITLFFLSPESIRWFLLAMIVGTIVGTYSSFFVATPLLVFWKKRS